MTRRDEGAGADEQTVEGPLTVARKGFGFIAHADGDVFVPRQHLAGAWHGDRVRALARGTERGRSGRVVEVLRRATSRLVGLLHTTRKGAWVEPDDARAGSEVLVHGALPLGAEGLVVGVELTNHPRRAGEPAGGKVVHVFGRRGSARDETDAILWREGVVESFLEVAEAEAAAAARKPASTMGREDLRHLAFVTIDPADAKDHDDALFAERCAEGFRLVVAIADVAAQVPAGSVLDQEARRRGCTLYCPDRTVPMLPAAISSGAASLVPDEDRLAVVLDARLSPEGTVLEHRFAEAVIRSRRRFTYEEAASCLAGGQPGSAAPEHHGALAALRDVAVARRSARTDRGAIRFTTNEVRVVVDPGSGQPRSIVRRPTEPALSESYGLVEEAMLLTNEVVSLDLERRGISTVFRVHSRPEPAKLAELASEAARLGVTVGPDLFDDARSVTAFLDGLAGEAAEVLVPLALEAMPRAAYAGANAGHFALGAASYTHFTSPIRRYPDLVVQRLLKEALRGGASKPLEPLDDLNDLSKRATRLARELVALHSAILLQGQVGEVLTGTVTSVARTGVHGTLDEPAVEVFCPIELLPGGPWELAGDTRRLDGPTGSLAVGARAGFQIEAALIGRRAVIAIPSGAGYP